VNSIAYSHQANFIAVGEDGCMEIFEAMTGQHQAMLVVRETAKCAAFSPDDTLLVNGCWNGTINLLERAIAGAWQLQVQFSLKTW
jgi:hypothetical protein